MIHNVVSIPLGNDPVFNDDDEITRLAIKTFTEFCHAMYSNQVGGDKDSFMGFCHDSYYQLMTKQVFPVVIDEDGGTWDITTIFFNVLIYCYELFFTALLSTMMEIHKNAVIIGVHSVQLRNFPYRIADLFFNVRHLITGPDIKK